MKPEPPSSSGTAAIPLQGWVCLGLAALSLLALAVGLVLPLPGIWQPAAVALSVALAVGLRWVPALRGYQLTMWIVAAVTAAMIYPTAFLHWGPLDLRHPWLLLIILQLLMFGMGIQMSLNDLRGVVK